MTHHRPPLATGPWLVVGLRRSGVAAARALWARGEAVLCVDSGTPREAAELRAEGLEVATGADGIAELGRARVLVKSPGVPREAPVVAEALRRGIPVLGELELGWRLVPAPFVAVTGTNGKTTTAELLGEIWRAAGRPVAVAGNVGRAVSSLAGTLEPGATVICEASSFQLEDAVGFAPDVALLLNLAPDHVDRHPRFEDYRDAKLRIFAHQHQHDVAIGPAGLLRGAGGAGRRIVLGDPDGIAIVDDQIVWQGTPLIETGEVALRGRHNLENALGAAAAALSCGIDLGAVRTALRGFTGLAHRLEVVAEQDGVLWVNDSKATNVASALVAIEAFEGAPLRLVLGGEAKDQDFAPLAGALASGVAAVYLIGRDAELIAAAIEGSGVTIERAGDLERAVGLARAAASAGEVVLLSPACSSFDQYPGGFEQRGEHFRALARA